MARLQVRMLGGFEARLDAGAELALKGRKAQALLACLALSPGLARARDSLTGLLWSERADEQARGSLRQALAELRRALDGAEPAPLDAGRESVTLVRQAVDSDVADLERLAAAGDPDSLARAVALYRGELLEGFGAVDPAFEDWLAGERARLDALAQEVMGRLLDHLTAAGETERAIDLARRLLALDPLREPVHRALMRLYAGQGDRALALKQYQACREVLARELGVAPEPETEALHGELRRGEAVPEPSPQPAAGPAPSLPDKPSLAVLPFVNMSADAEQEYFADGLTEDIITELSRFRSLFVIASNSSFAYKGRAVDVREVGRELGVHFVVEGSVRRAGQRVRVTAQLTEAATGNHLWAERYDRDMVDVFAVQDEITRTIAGTVGGRVEVADHRRVLRLSADDLAAYDLYTQAKVLIWEFTKENNAKARALLERAVALDPGLARAHAQLSLAHMMDWMAFWVADREAAERLFLDHARTAVRLDGDDSRTRWQLGEALVCVGEYDEARHQMETSMRLNPNDAEALGLFGFYLTAVGEPERALEFFEEAARLDPSDPNWRHWLKGIACYCARRYDEAIQSLIRVRDMTNEVRGWLAASHGQAGHQAEAKRYLDAFLDHAEAEMVGFPGRRLRDWEPYWMAAIRFRDRADLEHLLDGLRKAGLPE
jgi:TolB-like protein/Tfp pilus assembly protein PilF